MKAVFADTRYWVAVLNPDDELHEKAMSISAGLGNVSFITSEMVLTEVLNYFAGSQNQLRQAAVALVQRLSRHSESTIVPQTSHQFQAALSLYEDRHDKTWSLTDCSSFQIMERRQIAESLTHDKHFQQAGFKSLLRD